MFLPLYLGWTIQKRMPLWAYIFGISSPHHVSIFMFVKEHFKIDFIMLSTLWHCIFLHCVTRIQPFHDPYTTLKCPLPYTKNSLTQYMSHKQIVTPLIHEEMIWQKQTLSACAYNYYQITKGCVCNNHYNFFHTFYGSSKCIGPIL